MKTCLQEVSVISEKNDKENKTFAKISKLFREINLQNDSIKTRWFDENFLKIYFEETDENSEEARNMSSYEISTVSDFFIRHLTLTSGK